MALRILGDLLVNFCTGWGGSFKGAGWLVITEFPGTGLTFNIACFTTPSSDAVTEVPGKDANF